MMNASASSQLIASKHPNGVRQHFIYLLSCGGLSNSFHSLNLYFCSLLSIDGDLECGDGSRHKKRN